MTDGNLFKADSHFVLPKASPGPSPATAPWMVVDLGAPHRLDLLVIRDCSCEVESSLDEKRWSSLGRPSREDTIKPGGAVTARFVRVRPTATA